MTPIEQNPLPTLDQVPSTLLDGGTVLVRVDFNVPLEQPPVEQSHGGPIIVDDTRIREALPTLTELLGKGARVVVASHCGRPKGQHDEALSLAPIAKRLEELLAETSVAFTDDCVGQRRDEAVAALRPGSILVLENLRFHEQEKANDRDFARALARGCDVYVNDAFGCAHRAHASVAAITSEVATVAAGRLLVEEVTILSRLVEAPERPFVSILGGAKIEGKIDTLSNMVEVVDTLILGGGMANTFLASQGFEMQKSLVENDRLDTAREILERAKERGIEVLLPSDVITTTDLSPAQPETVVASVSAIPQGAMAVDIGPDSLSRFIAAIGRARSLFWNGPMGVFEKGGLETGSFEIARAVGACSGFTAIGGGETAAVANQAGADDIDHISTGGGASLQLLAGQPLPGVEALRTRGVT